MDCYTKSIKQLRHKKDQYSDKLSSTTFDIIETNVEIELGTQDYIVNMTKLETAEATLQRLESIKEETKVQKEELLKVVLRSSTVGFLAGSLALFVTHAISLPPNIIVEYVSAFAGGAFLINEVIFSIKPLAKLHKIRRFSKENNYEETRQEVKDLQYQLIKTKTKLKKLQDKKTKLEKTKQILNDALDNLNNCILAIINARCAVTHKLGYSAADQDLNRMYYSDKKINNIMRLERKKKDDN